MSGRIAGRDRRRAEPRKASPSAKRPDAVAPGLSKKLAPRVGFEPTTSRLTAGCSTTELPRIVVRGHIAIAGAGASVAAGGRAPSEHPAPRREEQHRARQD